MLHALGYGDDSYVLPETEKILSKYKLFGLIIHDPKVHTEFHAKLTSIFERLDYLTGPDFLFFGLLEPPPSFLDKANRDYFQIWEKQILLSPFNGYHSADESITAYSLSKALEIDYNDLPCIILTNDFKLKEFYFLKTCAKHLEKQMQEIGIFCSQKSEKVNVANGDLNPLMPSFNLCDGHELKKLKEPLAKILADSLSYIVANLNSHDSRNALRNARKLIKDHLKRPLSKINEYEFEKSNLQFISNLSNFLQGSNKVWFSRELKIDYDLPDIESRLDKNQVSEREPMYSVFTSSESVPTHLDDLEIESKIILKTFERIFPQYGIALGLSNMVKDEELDYSPLVISVGKVFEIETNLSIVQWIRKYLNIEMPAYFNQYKDDKINDYILTPSQNIVVSPRPIDFNMGKGKKWRAPGIGESELVMKSLYSEGNYPKLRHFDFELFLTHWSNIRRFRNNAAHSNLINQMDFSIMKKTFDELRQHGYLTNLTSLKKSLKNE